MRQIKFRAWDNVKNKIYYLGEESDVVFSFDSNGFVAEDITEHDWEFKKLEHLIYMQYTGLKDKDGAEIYEGDIYRYIVEINFDGVQRELEYTCEIHFLDGVFFAGDELLIHALDNDSESEIIGNIYENPELLEENK